MDKFIYVNQSDKETVKLFKCRSDFFRDQSGFGILTVKLKLSKIWFGELSYTFQILNGETTEDVPGEKFKCNFLFCNEDNN
jgi:hypothetical protein